MGDFVLSSSITSSFLSSGNDGNGVAVVVVSNVIVPCTHKPLGIVGNSIGQCAGRLKSVARLLLGHGHVASVACFVGASSLRRNNFGIVDSKFRRTLQSVSPLKGEEERNRKKRERGRKKIRD